MDNLTRNISRALSLNQRNARAQAPAMPTRPPLSQFSTPGVTNSAWSSLDFMLGAGMVIIQENTHKVVVVYEKEKDYWFFPRGRKDLGESLEQAALREGYEESGHRVEFMPHFGFCHAPAPPHDQEAYYRPNCEAIFITIMSWPARRKRGLDGHSDEGGEYLIHWYLGRIPEDAVPEKGTGMPDEQNYESHLLSADEAYQRVLGSEKRVLQFAWTLYQDTLKIYRDIQAQLASEATQTGGTPEDQENVEVQALESQSV